ncbi:MAG: phenylalanine--tRNA ligase subunit alpha [Thermoplasmata archaeon]
METLHPYEKEVLKVIKKYISSDKFTLEAIEDAWNRYSSENKISNDLQFSEQSFRGILERLCSKGILKTSLNTNDMYVITSSGKAVIDNGIPDEKVYYLLKEKKSLPLSEIVKYVGEANAVSAAIGRLKKNSIVNIEEQKNQKIVVLQNKEPDYINELKNAFEKISTNKKEVVNGVLEPSKIEHVSKDIAEPLEKYGFVKKSVVNERWYSLTEEGKELLDHLEDNSQVVEHITSEIIQSKKDVVIRPYDVNMPVKKTFPGLKNPYLEWVRKVRKALFSIGFVEYYTPIIESEFWNCDSLFMPQSHPARDIHDIFIIDTKIEDEVPIKFLEKVKNIHENGIGNGIGWGTGFSYEKSKQYILRSQTTAASAHFLSQLPKQPFKMFSIDKNFRPDSIDNKHNIEFYQCEGLIGGYGLTFRDLLGFMKKLSSIMGIEEIKFKPSYFPFTEPSVEGYINHPTLGWIEALPGGIIRPEIKEIFGIDYTILAWGLGIDRLAMASLGINDIRTLHDTKIE